MEEGSPIYSGDIYAALVEECRAIIIERGFRARTEIIIAKSEIGQRISEDSLYKKHGKGNRIFLLRLAVDIGISYSELNRCIQLYEKFGVFSHSLSSPWDTFKEGKAISWWKIVHKYLPTAAEEKPTCEHELIIETIAKCKRCGVKLRVR